MGKTKIYVIKYRIIKKNLQKTRFTESASVINKDYKKCLKNLSEENIKFNLNEYMNKEVLPFAPYSYIDDSKTKIGYEISFTKYFYIPEKLKTSKELLDEIIGLDKELDGMIKELYND